MLLAALYSAMVGCSSPEERCASRFIDGPAIQQVPNSPWTSYHLIGADKAFREVQPPPSLSDDLAIRRVDDRLTVYTLKARDTRSFAADVKTVCAFASKHSLEVKSTMHGSRPSPTALKAIGY